MAGPLTDALAVLVVAAFAVGAAVDALGRRGLARLLMIGAWSVFAVFWAVLVPHFLITKGSVVEGVLTLIAVPASAYVGLLLYRGRTSLITLSRAVAVMGIVYLPFQLVDPLARPLVAAAVGQVHWTMTVLGYDPTMVVGSEVGERLGIVNGFLFTTGGHRYITEIVLACTGLGSIAIFAGLVAAVDAPIRRKVSALAIVVPIIYVLNVARVTFIALAHGNQWFRITSLAGPVAWLMGIPYEEALNRVSWYVADRIIAQSLSVLALVVVALLAVRVLPELVTLLEEAVYVITGREYDLSAAMGADRAAPDGGERLDE